MRWTIHKYILREILAPYFLSLVILTFVLLMFQLLKLTEWVIAYGVSIVDVGRLISFVLPPFLVFTIPMAYLLAVLLAFARMSADSELVAFRASGVSLIQLYPMVALLSILTTIAALAITVYAEPWGKRSLKEFAFELARTKATIALEERVFSTQFKDIVLYVNQVDPANGRIEGVFISDERGDDPREKNIVLAREGFLMANPNELSLVLRLVDGSVHFSSPEAASYQVADFETYDVDIQLGAAITRNTKKTYMEMSVGDLREHIGTLRETAEKTDDRADWYAHNRAHVEYHKKFAFPFAAIVFGILGVPLSINPVRSGRSRGFSLALAVLITYYLLLRLGETVGWSGVLHPIVVMWAPNVILAALGIWLLVNKTRETEVAVQSRFDRVIAAVRGLLEKR